MGSVHGVMFNGLTSSNPQTRLFVFHITLIPEGKV